MRLMILGIAAVLAAGSGPARAQLNLDAGKTPPQLFSSHCSACHKSPQGLAKGQDAGSLGRFLLQHYTTSRENAAALGAYVASIPEPRQATRQPAASPAASPNAAHVDPRLPNGAPAPTVETRRTPAAETAARPRRAPGEPATVEGDPPAVAFRPEPRPVVETEADRARARMVFDSPGLAARTAEAAAQGAHKEADGAAAAATASIPAAPAPPAPEAAANSGSQPTFSDPVP